VFLGGGLATRLEEVASEIAARRPGIPLVLAGGTGVLSDEGELEEQSAASGVVWAGGRAEACPIDAGAPDALGESLARLLADRTGKTAPTVLVFASPEGFGPGTLLPLRQARGTPYLFGAGTTGSPGSAAIDADGRVFTGPLAFILRGIAAPAIRTTHACRLLTPLTPITACRGAMVLEIGGRPALEVLTDAGKQLDGRQLVLTILAEQDGLDASEGGRPALIIRGIQGVDSDRGGLVVSDEIYEGMRIAFGVRDANAARDDIDAVTRELARDIGGAAPRFGVYINCAGRGFDMYGTPGVDTRALRLRFPGVPFAGMHSSFEIAPHAGRPTLQLYTGVFALFTAPS
jgi:small ligand-binding sensory domain FIST